MSSTMKSDNCTHLLNPNPYTVALAALILLGILISYLPQHIKIITRRSSAGLSPYWVLLGGLSSIAAIANILVLPRSREDMRCCRTIGGGECAAALLGVAQIGLQWGCFMFIVFLFLTFFQPTPPTNTTDPSQPSKPPSKPRREALLVGASIITTILLTFFASLVVLWSSSTPAAQTWANTLGTCAAVLSMIQWCPQIYFTYLRGSIGSLSILTMLIQVPGAFLFAFSLWLRVGWGGWSAWGVFCVTGVLQGGLLGLAVYFWFRGVGEVEVEVREEITGVIEGEGDAVDERSALLGNGAPAGQKGGLSSGREGESGASYATITPQQNGDPGGSAGRIT